MAATNTTENFLRSGEVSLKGFIAGFAQSKVRDNRHKTMVLYHSTFIIAVYRNGEKLLVSKEFNIGELTKARRFYRSIRFFKTHSTWSEE
jgi:hypothetical protein